MNAKKITRVHRIHRPLIVGETVLVPHYVGSGGHATPVLWPPHKDVHDGQPSPHYHNDERFQEEPTFSRWFPVDHARIEWRPTKVVRSQCTDKTRTRLDFIDNAIKHVKCNALIKGRCPHKGFNMDQVELNEHGLKVCPMHGMRFDKAGKGVPYLPGQAEGDAPVDPRVEEKQWRDG